MKKDKIREVFAEDWEEYKGTKFTIYDSNRNHFWLALSLVFIFTVLLVIVMLLEKPKAVEFHRPDASIPPLVEVEELQEPFRLPVKPSMLLPDVSGGKKTYMDYMKISRKGSMQLLLQETRAYTDSQGFRKVDEYYLVAMGTYYVKEIGDTFEVSFADGQTIKVMAGDVKADCHTDINNQYHLSDGSIIEFIIDKKVMNEKVIRTGDCSWLIGHGAVTEIRRIG